jgi:hypothetical protein
MHDRSALGPADVPDERLAGMVADLLGTDPASTTLVGSVAEEVEYDLPAITTAGRYWVRGTARVDHASVPFTFFVKHVQSWSRSPFFESVPVEYRPMAEASVPWRTEPLAYRSDLRDRLPDGLTMPRALGVFDLDELSASVWLEAVQVHAAVWDTDRYARAAHLLGRLAGSSRVRELANVGQHDFHVRDYLGGRLRMQVLPMLHDERVWEHPLVAAAYDADLRARLLEAADRAPDIVEELSAFPMTTSHGDACPNNLLTRAGSDGFVLIDYGFWTLQPVGFDLAQLLVGDVQVGRRAAGSLREVEDAVVPAYAEGLAAEGWAVPEPDLRRAHALQLLIFTGLSTIPVEHFERPPTPELHRLAADRAALARFSLDLLDATA